MASELSNKNYIAIADWMCDLGLNTRQTLLFALIYGFSQDGEVDQDNQSCFYGSLEYLEQWLGIEDKKWSQRCNVLRYLQPLVKKGLLIKTDKKDKGCQRVCEYRTTIDRGSVINNPDVSYITIKPFMVKDMRLNGKSLFLYALINGFSKGGNHCSYNKEYYAKWLHCRKNNVDRYVQNALSDGLLKTVGDGFITIKPKHFLLTQTDNTLKETKKLLTQTDNTLTQTDNTSRLKVITNNISSEKNTNKQLKDLDLSLPIFDTKERRKQYKQVLKQISSLYCSRESMIKFWNKIAENDFKDPEGKPIKNMAGYMVSILSKNPHIKKGSQIKFPDYDKMTNELFVSKEEARKAIKRRQKEQKEKQQNTSMNEKEMDWYPFEEGLV